MRFLAAAFSLVLSAALAAAQAPVLNTPVGVQECYNTQLTWSGGVGPFQIQVLPGSQPAATPLETIGTFTGISTTWLCKQAANTQIFLRLRDTSSGQISETATVTVGPGTTGCANSTASAPASDPAASTPAASTPAASTPAGTTPAGTTPAGTTPAASNGGTSTRAQSASSSRTSAASSSSTTPGGAGQLKAPVALAVSAAALAMAVFA